VARMRYIRTPGWKLVRHFEPGVEDEMYDLANDPGETRNLAGSPDHKTRRAELAEKLNRWMSSIDDPLAAKESAR